MTFFAVLLDENTRGLFSERLKPWWLAHPSLAWVHPEDLHMTLRFLGGMTREAATRLGETFPRDIPLSSFALPMTAGLVFDKGRHGGVLSAMPAIDIPELHGLHDSLEERVRKLGFQPELQAFRPHVTLARFTLEQKNVVQDFCEVQLGADWGILPVDHYRLMKRRDKKDETKTDAPYPPDPNYETLARFALLE